MQPRATQFRDRVQYFFDCAQEGWELDAGSALTLELYGDEQAISQIIDAPGAMEPIPSHYRNRQHTCLRLAAMADDILPHLPEERRAGITQAGLRYVAHAIADLAETMSCWTIEDEIDGGCMEPFRDRPRSRNGITNKKTVRRLMAPKFIRRYVKNNAPEHADHLVNLHRVVARRAQHIIPKHDPELMRLYRAQIAAAAPRYDRMMQEAFPHLRKLSAPSRDNRKIIKRSLNIATSLLGEDTVRSFLRGEQIRLIGTDTMLLLRKRGSLAARGHGCLSIAIADREGTTLADLCTYIENTPTLDQLCGFALWMNAGEERKIMETANITKLADGSREHPIIAHHYEYRHQQMIADLGPDTQTAVQDMILGNRRRSFQLSYEEKRERARQYWEKTKGEWIEAMMVAVIGYRNFPIYRLAGAL